ncbi:MAG: DUF3797 domain-containing protein [Peptococcaceae bacterium]|nr:DUF3797 domain-containing protein [Peptococcaceae bacterium]
MTIDDAIQLTVQYSRCPNCGCDTIGGGTGTLEIDTEIGCFKRTCQCGWSIEISTPNK